MGFLMSYQQSRVSPLTSPEWDLDTQICRFSKKFRLKPLKVRSKVSLSKNFQQQCCNAINYLSNGINILAANNAVPVKFGPKGTDFQ